MVYRRIGRNEMSAIDACGAYVAAQKEYAEKLIPLPHPPACLAHRGRD